MNNKMSENNQRYGDMPMSHLNSEQHMAYD